MFVHTFAMHCENWDKEIKRLLDKPVVDVARDAQCCAQAVADRHTDR